MIPEVPLPSPLFKASKRIPRARIPLGELKKGERYASHGSTARRMKLTIELVPQPCWYSNLHEKMPRSAWDKLRKQVYAQYNNQCSICQASNVTLSCHEMWDYDDTTRIQKLYGFIALCAMCHHCKHIGLARILASKGRLDLEQVKHHFIRVNGCTSEDFAQHEAKAWETWKKRNRFVWTTDLGNYTSLIE